MAANVSAGAEEVRLVFGTLDLPDTELAPALLDRYVDAAAARWTSRTSTAAGRRRAP